MKFLVLLLLPLVGSLSFVPFTPPEYFCVLRSSRSTTRPTAVDMCSARAATAVFASSSVSMASTADKKIYGVPNSGWTSPQWNWGSASGTGHDCAAICRRTYGTREARQDLVSSLLSGEIAIDFEEVKLTMALAWQNGRWDGSDGGSGGYGDVLHTMAQARRYEEGSVEECARHLAQDMRERFALLKPTKEQRTAMDRLHEDIQDPVAARNRCSGLVLQAMGFVENG